jgi:hypothetical protein
MEIKKKTASSLNICSMRIPKTKEERNISEILSEK